ncbi:hypothetical protein [Chryseobacterium oryzae]|uniref:Uncharacterized protein n=1 Tax=Chryseobacterium oryzae TaxID=2929799 RepID=A0ABY4BCS7_9FLAO|nr:hypothetical protein [Chryseobacterium oryzae]UOE36952.1 hypothetical protein MTP08_07690 [Chryseobacterium oryzae]
MQLTSDLKEQFINHSNEIKIVRVVYKKKKVVEGKPAIVTGNPFDIKLFDSDKKDENNSENFHSMDFDSAIEVSLIYFDDSIKVFRDH